MELEIYLKYKASTGADIISQDSRELSSDDELSYYLDFRRQNSSNFKCTIKDDLKEWMWMDILEPTVDESTIDFPQLEIVTVGQSYDSFTNTIFYRVVLRLELCDGATEDDVLIHKNKLKCNVLEWLNKLHRQIKLKDDKLGFVDNKMIYCIPTTEVRYDDLDVKYKLRK